MEQETSVTKLNIEQIVADILNTIEREREREIVARRYGLYDRKETLEQIGELLNITRERVRQLEKAVVAKLKAVADKDLPMVKQFEEVAIAHISSVGHVARVSDLSAKLTKENSKIDQSRVSFLAQLSPKLSVIDDNDHFFHAIGVRAEHDEKKIRESVGEIVSAIKEIGKPVDSKAIHEAIGHADHVRVTALASISIPLTTIVPNIISVHPPNTDSGIELKNAPIGGTNPASIINIAPVIIVNLFTTFVIATIPTFCE